MVKKIGKKIKKLIVIMESKISQVLGGI